MAEDRLIEVRWLLEHLDDVRSDLSVYHGIDVDDVESMPARRFFLLAERLPAYGGVVAVAVRRAVADQSGSDQPGTDQAADAGPPAVAPGATAGAKVLIGPEQAAQLLAQPLYGDIPGLGPAFSFSFAPLAPESEGDSDA